MQAQALLLADDIYAPSYRKRMLIPHEFRPGLCQEHNKTVAKAEKVTPVKVFLNPMHLLVQQAYLQDKVCGATRSALCCQSSFTLVLS